MNKRQRKKQFKKLHGMNPNQYFLEKAMPEIVKVVVDVATAMVKVSCKLNGTLWEIARVRMANANLLKNPQSSESRGRERKENGVNEI